jgi:hypothetical protein
MAAEVDEQRQARYPVSKFEIEPSFRENIPSLQLHPANLVRTARALADENIPIVEYGGQLQYRFGHPAVLVVGDAPYTKYFLITFASADFVTIAC